MATKRNPGTYDCYTKADIDEPMFVLLGRDPTAATIVRGWVVTREHLAEQGIIVRDDNHIRQINEALDLARQLETYAGAMGKEQALQVLRDLDPLAHDERNPVALDTHPLGEQGKASWAKGLALGILAALNAGVPISERQEEIRTLLKMFHSSNADDVKV